MKWILWADLERQGSVTHGISIVEFYYLIIEKLFVEQDLLAMTLVIHSCYPQIIRK